MGQVNVCGSGNYIDHIKSSHNKISSDEDANNSHVPERKDSFDKKCGICQNEIPELCFKRKQDCNHFMCRSCFRKSLSGYFLSCTVCVLDIYTHDIGHDDDNKSTIIKTF
jgi:hypothetical protein